MDLVRNEFRMESCQELVKIHGIYFACVDLAEVMHVILELGFFNSSSSSSSVNAIVVNNSGSSFLQQWYSENSGYSSNYGINKVLARPGGRSKKLDLQLAPLVLSMIL